MNFTLRPWQAKVHASASRFRAVVGARQIGLTEFGLQELLTCWQSPPVGGRNYLYVAPERKQARMVAFKRMREWLPANAVNVSGLTMNLGGPGGDTIYFAGADPCELRGLTVDGVVVDCADYINPALFDEVIEPCLAASGGWALLVGTPTHCERLLHREVHAYPQRFQCWKFDHTAGGLPPERIADLKHRVTNEEFQREMLAQWTNP